MKFTFVTVTTATVLALALPAAASCLNEPLRDRDRSYDRATTLSPRVPTGSWASEVGVGSYVGVPWLYDHTQCQPPSACDATLVQLTSAGDLAVSVTPRMPSDVARVAVRLHRSDASGAVGAEMSVQVDARGNAKTLTASRLPAGYYLAAVEWFEGATDYAGKATLVPTRR